MAWPTMLLDVSFVSDATAASPTWVDVSSRLLDFSCRRGRNMELDQTELGQATAILHNQDRALDPLNTAGAYYPNVVPVRPTRMRATVISVTYNIFRGDVPDWPQDWQNRHNTVPITMVDGFDALQVADFTTSRPAEYSGARINAILDAIGWPAGFRSIDAGQSLIQPIDYDVANALTSLQEIATAENGVLFMNGAGNIVFHNRHRRILDTTLQATFSSEPAGGEFPLADAKLIYRRERLWNTVNVTQTGGATATATDATASAHYRRRSLSRTVQLSDFNECAGMAEWFRDSYKDPVVRVEEVVIEPQTDDGLWAHALGREIGDRIRVKFRAPGNPSALVTSDVTIEGIEHVTNGSLRRWQTIFRCSPSTTGTYWLVGTGELGDTSGTTTTRIGY